MNGLIIGLIVPLVGTIFGAATVYCINKELPAKLNNLLMGFTSGIMVAAAIWSLIMPSLEMTESRGFTGLLLVVGGFMTGVCILLIMDYLIPHMHTSDSSPEGLQSNISRTWKLVLAVILHNIPEGMAIGIALAAASENVHILSIASAIALSVGIAIQNIPEGAIVSVPLRLVGNSKNRAFGIGVFSGIVQPVAAILTIWLASMLIPLMPFLLSLAGGAMIYVVVEELIPSSRLGEHTNLGSIGFSFGFVIMLILDYAI